MPFDPNDLHERAQRNKRLRFARGVRPSGYAALVTRAALLALLPRVIGAFAKLGMRDHMRFAVELERATRQGRAATPDRHGNVWGAGMVVTWAKRLRVPPYEEALPVHAYEYRCPCSHLADKHTRGVWPGGSLAYCTGCDSEWIVLDGVRAR